jgi:hypothetical protein
MPPPEKVIQTVQSLGALASDGLKVVLESDCVYRTEILMPGFRARLRAASSVFAGADDPLGTVRLKSLSHGLEEPEAPE